MNAIYKTVLLFIGIAILVKQGAFEDIQAFVSSQPSVTTEPIVQEERKPEEVNYRTPVVAPSPVNNPVAVAPTPVDDSSAVATAAASGELFPEEARKTVYCIKALQLKEGVVPVGAVLRVQSEFADYYVVKWRGYVFRASRDSVTDNREDGSRAVGNVIREQTLARQREEAAVLARSEQAQDEAARRRQVASTSQSLLHPDKPSKSSDFTQNRSVYPSKPSYAVNLNVNYQERARIAQQNAENQRRANVLKSDIAALSAAKQADQRKLEGEASGAYYNRQNLRDAQIRARKEELRSIP